MSDLRKELRELRKQSAAHTSVSKMKLRDVAMEVGRLRAHLEVSPSVAMNSGTSKKPMKGTVEPIKEAKKAEFPVKPAGSMDEAKAPKKKAAAAVVSEAEPEAKAPKGKGSPEMAAKMAAIRSKKEARVKGNVMDE